MNRRKALQSSGIITIGLASQMIGKNVFANDGQCPEPKKQFTTKVEISNNHSHEFALKDLDSAIALLQDVHANGPMTVDIKGTSGHGHEMTITAKSLLQLIATGTVQLEASVVFGHGHTVTLSLLNQAQQNPE